MGPALATCGGCRAKPEGYKGSDNRSSPTSVVARGAGVGGAWHQRVADDAGIDRPVRRQRTWRFVRQLQQSAVGGVGEHGMRRRQRRRQPELGVALLQVVDAREATRFRTLRTTGSSAASASAA